VSLRHSPLHHEHEQLGARFVDFGGFEMPLAYPTGTLAEHLACRRDAVVFDVSHLGTVRLVGPDAKGALQRGLSNDLDRIAPGHAQYTHLLDEEGAVLDDCIVWWVDEERFDLMPNASNTERVRAAVGGDDVTAERAVLAVQGPRAREQLATVAPEAAAVGHFGVAPFSFGGAEGVVAGTGYTGEDGVECALPPEAAAALLRALVAQGVVPAGLGARDTLRLEACLPLHGHELGAGITPLQAGLSWVVAFDKGPFTGREALVSERAAGPARRLRALLGGGRRPFHAGEGCTTAIGPGVLTSGNFSPVLGRGIALAFLPPSVAPGEAVTVEARGGPRTAAVVKGPFHRLDVKAVVAADELTGAGVDG